MQRPYASHDPFDAPYANAGRLYEAGVKFCIRSRRASNILVVDGKGDRIQWSSSLMNICKWLFAGLDHR